MRERETLLILSQGALGIELKSLVIGSQGFLNPHQIKAVLRDQAFTGRAQVSCAIGIVVAVRRRKGRLLALVRGWGVHWYPVESVLIEYANCWLLS